MMWAIFVSMVTEFFSVSPLLFWKRHNPDTYGLCVANGLPEVSPIHKQLAMLTATGCQPLIHKPMHTGCTDHTYQAHAALP